MAKVEITERLFEEMEERFKGDATEVFDLLATLEENPAKGKALGAVGGIVIKELKYKGFRFYFITDGFTLKCMDERSLSDLLLRVVRMSDKKRQQQTIEEIKLVLRTIGPGGFG